MKEMMVAMGMAAMVCLLPFASAEPSEAKDVFLGQASSIPGSVALEERWCGGKLDADCDLCLRWADKYKWGIIKVGRECIDWEHCALYTNVHSLVSGPKCHNTPGDFIDPIVL